MTKIYSRRGCSEVVFLTIGHRFFHSNDKKSKQSSHFSVIGESLLCFFDPLWLASTRYGQAEAIRRGRHFLYAAKQKSPETPVVL
ncbi:hypothetical protein A8L34_20580 [Bacillus sp. FJAT-27264]|uniref:hypothetical protein n=1 Tax=Paenibacillus sp. (strain DSM 101736 / FJAT-27264) TaxID=1850362 RepID=UPI000807F808|nr:hypothetical protein [Bacillus sp. FJAT-27264]OBZ09676.1 hypothetical protein A8L34_20580 [Bacillus sp. FJAT-27264]